MNNNKENVYVINQGDILMFGRRKYRNKKLVLNYIDELELN